MMRRLSSAFLVGLLLVCISSRAAPQGGAIDLQYGRWAADAGYSEIRGGLSRPLFGPFWYTVGGMALIGDSGRSGNAFYGAVLDVTVLRHHGRLGPYGVAGVAAGVHTALAPALGVSWSAGAGMEWNPLAAVGLLLELRYRAQDQGAAGFWRLQPGASRAVALTLGTTVRWGFRGVPRPAARRPVAPPAVVTGDVAGVVQTALGAMGTPYRWGGSDQNGFDCSGLIHYAFAEHGITLPRVSAEQARAGLGVERTIDAVRPGDVLAFSAVPGGHVTHVGLYVGESKFIHSSRGGVAISTLAADDPEGEWWWRRWVAARRVR